MRFVMFVNIANAPHKVINIHYLQHTIHLILDVLVFRHFCDFNLILLFCTAEIFSEISIQNIQNIHRVI